MIGMDKNTLVNRKSRRTTLTLEADVAEYLSTKLAQNRELKEKTLVNDLLRKGINAEAAAKPRPFKIRPFKTSLARGIDAAEIENLLDEI